MFTGIIEAMGRVEEIRPDGSNVHIALSAPFKDELKVDQSVAHNGVCLTVTKILAAAYEVTAIDETLKRSNLGKLCPGDHVNLERCMPMNGRLDGHIVQGHVDTVARCTKVEKEDGSWLFHFHYTPKTGEVTVEKGSITINGVSLTVVDSGEGFFSVAIIPYTYEHTVFKYLKEGDEVNIEFDIIGKYVARLLAERS